MLPKERVARFKQCPVEARETISPHYDGVVREVQQRIFTIGRVDKTDIAVLGFWKRLRVGARWVPDCSAATDSALTEGYSTEVIC